MTLSSSLSWSFVLVVVVVARVVVPVVTVVVVVAVVLRGVVVVLALVAVVLVLRALLRVDLLEHDGQQVPDVVDADVLQAGGVQGGLRVVAEVGQRVLVVQQVEQELQQRLVLAHVVVPP